VFGIKRDTVVCRELCVLAELRTGQLAAEVASNNIVDESSVSVLWCVIVTVHQRQCFACTVVLDYTVIS
jgi:hypothetical protein